MNKPDGCCRWVKSASLAQVLSSDAAARVYDACEAVFDRW